MIQTATKQPAQAPAPDLFQDSAESTSAIYTQLYKLVRPELRHYVTDLIKHDRNLLEQYTGPFIYGYRATGTSLIKLLPDFKAYEEEGLKVGAKYIFSNIRDHSHQKEIIRDQITWITGGLGNKFFYYYDGNKLTRKTIEQIKDIHQEHTDKVLEEYRRAQEALRTQYN